MDSTLGEHDSSTTATREVSRAFAEGAVTKDEALKLALQALERCVATCFDPYAHEQAMSWPEHFVNQTITAIKEALAQPEQEPVAWITEWEGQYSSGKILDYIAHTRGGKVEYTPLYTTPPQRTWVGLTDEDDIYWEDGGTLRDLVKAIEAKLKEKNNG